MSDKTLGMILATAIAAPVMIICCGGGLALLSSVLAGATGGYSGLGGPMSVLVAIGVGGFLLALRRWRRSGDACARPGSPPEIGS